MELLTFIITAAIITAFSALITFTLMKKKFDQDCESKINASATVAERLGYISGINAERQAWWSRAHQASAAGTPWVGVTLPVIVSPVDNQQDPNRDPPAY